MENLFVFFHSDEWKSTCNDAKRFFSILRHHSALMRCLRCFEVMEQNDENKKVMGKEMFLHKALFLDTLEAFMR